jgi:hypothetical protein
MSTVRRGCHLRSAWASAAAPRPFARYDLTPGASLRTQAHPGIVHELSPDSRRPFCGADPILESAPRDAAQPVDCEACLRLLEDDERRGTHAAHPRAVESED